MFFSVQVQVQVIFLFCYYDGKGYTIPQIAYANLGGQCFYLNMYKEVTKLIN